MKDASRSWKAPCAAELPAAGHCPIEKASDSGAGTAAACPGAVHSSRIQGGLKITGRFQTPAFAAIVLIATLLTAPVLRAEEIVFRIDFTGQPDGDATGWLKKQGFEFKRNAERLNPHFENGRLVLETDGQEVGLIVRELDLTGVERVRIRWGVDRYPRGADWEEGVYRVPIAAMISFGEEKIDSGAFYVPNAPYFIGLFLGEKEQEGRAYKAQYYRKGGRYFCVPCSPPTEQTVITDFNLKEAFDQQFDVPATRPITSFGVQMNTEDTQGGARAFLETVEFFSGQP